LRRVPEHAEASPHPAVIPRWSDHAARPIPLSRLASRPTARPH
jgi:hypothetical protein